MNAKTILILLPACLLLGGCKQGKSDKATVHHVMCIRPLPMGNEPVKSFPGRIKEAREISLGFKTAGQIERIYVKEGDFVREGELMAELDYADYQLGVEALQVQAEQLEHEVARMKQLYEAKSISENDYEKAVAGLRQLKVQLQLNRNKLDYTRLQAPSSGYIQSVNFEPAEMVDAGTPVFTLLNTDRLEVELDIPADIYLQKDRIKDIRCRTGVKDSLPMKLLSITPKADGTQLYRMRLTFDGKTAESLTAGMNADVELRMTPKTDSGNFILPVHAVCKAEGKTYVWTVGKDSTTHQTPVTLQGIDENGQAIISSGLTGDEQIVKAGVSALQENEKVNILAEPAETNVGGLL